MNAKPAPLDLWPALPLAAWQDTCDTLHMWTQVVGKYEAVRTAASPEDELASFLKSTYDHAARLANWDRETLER